MIDHPEYLTDEQVARLITHSGGSPHRRSLAREVLASRPRITELEAERSIDLNLIARLEDRLRGMAARMTYLEAQEAAIRALHVVDPGLRNAEGVALCGYCRRIPPCQTIRIFDGEVAP